MTSGLAQVMGLWGLNLRDWTSCPYSLGLTGTEPRGPLSSAPACAPRPLRDPALARHFSWTRLWDLGSPAEGQEERSVRSRRQMPHHGQASLASHLSPSWSFIPFLF